MTTQVTKSPNSRSRKASSKKTPASEIKPKPAKKGRGRKPKKRDPILHCKKLLWPEGTKQTLRDAQAEGPYRLNLTENMVKEGRTRMDQATKQIMSLGKRIGIPWITITWSVTDANNAVDGNHPEPGVAVYYWNEGKERVVSCDRWHSPVANLKSCIETIQGFWLLIRAGCVHGMSSQMEAYTGGLIRRKADKAEGLTKLSMHEDWQRILGIHDDHVDDIYGMPKDDKVIKNALSAAVRVYHPDSSTDPDKGESFKLIQATAEYVREQIKRIKNIQASQEEVKEKARQEAEVRATEREKREAERKAPKVLNAKTKKKAEDDNSDIDREFDQTPQYTDVEKTVDQIAAEGYCREDRA